MLFQETFFGGITKTWVWDGLALIPYGDPLQTYIFSYCNYIVTTACWRTFDFTDYPDGINKQFYVAILTYRYIINGESSIQVNVEVAFVGFTIERKVDDILESKPFNLSAQVYFNGDRLFSISSDFTLLFGMQSTNYTIPDLGHKSYNLSEGTYIGTVVLPAPGLNLVSKNFTANVAG